MSTIVSSRPHSWNSKPSLIEMIGLLGNLLHLSRKEVRLPWWSAEPLFHETLKITSECLSAKLAEPLGEQKDTGSHQEKLRT